MMTTPEFVTERTFAASVRTVWRAWTDPALFARWFGPIGTDLQVLEADFSAGGGLHFEMRMPGMAPLRSRFRYQAITPRRQLCYVQWCVDAADTPIAHPGLDGWPVYFENTVDFEDLGDRTRVRIRARAVDASAAQHAAFEAEFGGIGGGWIRNFGSLDALLDTLVRRNRSGALGLVTEGPDRVILDRSFAAPVERVFEAFTTPALIQRWMLGPDDRWTMPLCTVDLRPGGESLYVWRNGAGEEMSLKATFDVVEPPTRLVHREIFEPDWTGGETRVTTRFVADGAGTRVIMEIDYPTPEARALVLESPMLEGMESGYGKLDALLVL